MATDLLEPQRLQLDGIVQRMESAGEPDENIRAVVADFKQKYATAPGPPPVPSLLQDAMEPFRRAAVGVASMPGAVARGVAGLKDVDYGQLITEPGTTLEAAKETGRQFAPAVLPTVGAIIGSAVGPAGTVAGATGGEFLNAAIRQLASGQAEKPLDVLTEGATTGVTAAGGLAVPLLVKSAMRAGVKELPGAGVELQAAAIPKAEALVEKLTPGMPAVRKAYANVRGMGNPQVDMSRLRQVAQEVLDHETVATKPNIDLMDQAKRILDSSATGWDWEHAISEVRRMGEQLRRVKKIEGEAPKELSGLYRSLRDSVDNAMPVGGQMTPQLTAQTEAWRAAQKLARRQFASEDLAERINTAAGKSGEMFDSFSVNKVLKWIDQQERAAKLGHPDTAARRFVESWEPGELADIKQSLHEIGRDMAALPSMKGLPVGSSQRLLAYGVGQGIGVMTGHPYYGGWGGIVGGEVISRLLQTDGGRTFIRQAMKINPNVMSPEFAYAGVAFLDSQGANPAGESTDRPAIPQLIQRALPYTSLSDPVARVMRKFGLD